MQKLVLVIATALALTRSVAQDSRFWLATTIGKADTVWLISHKDLSRRLDSRGHLPTVDRLLLQGSLDPAILLQKKILGRPMLDSITDILAATIEFDRVEEALCFDPHQAIVWSKDGKLSYIDCCFHCLRYVASSDLTPLMGKNFGYRKWAMLERFFEVQGLLGPIPKQ